MYFRFGASYCSQPIRDRRAAGVWRKGVIQGLVTGAWPRRKRSIVLRWASHNHKSCPILRKGYNLSGYRRVGGKVL